MKTLNNKISNKIFRDIIFTVRPDLIEDTKIYIARRRKLPPYYVFSLHDRGVSNIGNAKRILLIATGCNDESIYKGNPMIELAFLIPVYSSMPKTIGFHQIKPPSDYYKWLVGVGLPLKDMALKIPYAQENRKSGDFLL